MGSSKSLKFPAFLKKSDLLLFFSSLLIGLKRREFSNFWKIPFLVRIVSLYLCRNVKNRIFISFLYVKKDNKSVHDSKHYTKYLKTNFELMLDLKVSLLSCRDLSEIMVKVMIRLQEISLLSKLGKNTFIF